MRSEALSSVEGNLEGIKTPEEDSGSALEVELVTGVNASSIGRSSAGPMGLLHTSISGKSQSRVASYSEG